MHRILIIGPGGAGKSELATQLGLRTGLPVTHLDTLYWKPGWVEPADEVWRAQVAALLAKPEWILDGNYGGTMAMRFAAADTVIFLDLPPGLCIRRVLKRWWTYRGSHRPSMTEGCPERISWGFLWWIWTYGARRRPEVLRQAAAAGVVLVHLRTPEEVEGFLAGIRD
jgi:adenylate kinase family enzyme